MNKKGISPLIATILLIGFGTILAFLVFSYGTNVVDDLLKNAERSPIIELSFDSEWIEENTGCLESIDNYCYSILITNNEGFTVNYIITTITSEGVTLNGPEEYELFSYEPKTFIISYPKELGNEEVNAKIRAVKF
jgi:hypothetical protein